MTRIAGRFALAAPIIIAGVVLSHDERSTTPSSGWARIISSTSIAIRLRNIIVVGDIVVSPSEMTGNSSGKPPACQTPRLTASATSCRWIVAVIQFAPRVADADDRPPVHVRARVPRAHQEGPRDRPPLAILAEPTAAEIWRRHCHDYLPPSAQRAPALPKREGEPEGASLCAPCITHFTSCSPSPSRWRGGREVRFKSRTTPRHRAGWRRVPCGRTRRGRSRGGSASSSWRSRRAA